MKNHNMVALRERVYDSRCRLQVMHSALGLSFDISETEGNGYLGILCDVMHELETVETRLTPDDSPISAISELPKIVQFPGNGNGTQLEIQTDVVTRKENIHTVGK